MRVDSAACGLTCLASQERICWWTSWAYEMVV